MIGIVSAALTAAKSNALASAAQAVGSLFGGQTATDRERIAQADQLLALALSGNPAALRQLEFNAFEPRRGLTGDNRRPADGKMSPAAVVNLAKARLKSYYQQTGQFPSPQYAAKLGITLPVAGAAGVYQQMVQPVLQQIGASAADSAMVTAQQRATDGLKAAMPWIVGALLLAVLGVVLMRRG